MTKKDYITIANALKPFYKQLDALEQEMSGISSSDNNALIIEIITALSKAMSKDNPRFNPVRFLDMIRGKDKQQ